jgi:hypothetical protein
VQGRARQILAYVAAPVLIGPALLATGIAFLEEVYFVAEPVEVPGNWGDVPGVGR